METLDNLSQAFQDTAHNVIDFCANFVQPLEEVYPNATFPTIGDLDIGSLSLLTLITGTGLAVYVLYVLLKFLLDIFG